MTPQIGEVFLMNQEQYFINEHPLHPYFIQLNNPPYFTPPSPTCWRGYYGKWELRENELFLINFRGYVDGFDEVDLSFIFPRHKEIFASWFTGKIKVPQGKVIKWNETLNASIHEEYLHLSFENGVLTHYDCIETNLDKETEYSF